MSNFEDLISANKLFDSHCHLNSNDYDGDRGEVVKRAKASRLDAIIDMGVDIRSCKKAIKFSRKYDIVKASAGIDPENLIPGSDLFKKTIFDLSEQRFQNWLTDTKDELTQLASQDNVYMIGETGMDNFWLSRNTTLSLEEKQKSLSRQEDLLKVHIGLSKQIGKPLSIHSRNASSRCLELLTTNNNVFHSLTPDIGFTAEKFYQVANKILESGNYIGINGIITFKNAALIRDTYLKIIKEKTKNLDKYNLLEILYQTGFVLETDGPYLAPAPHRGERNEPAYISFILRTLNLLV